jgi:hypothetical protein
MQFLVSNLVARTLTVTSCGVNREEEVKVHKCKVSSLTEAWIYNSPEFEVDQGCHLLSSVDKLCYVLLLLYSSIVIFFYCYILYCYILLLYFSTGDHKH